MERTWKSAAPTECGICGDIIIDEFVDGETKEGIQAPLCLSCYGAHGSNGQHYKLVDADFVDVRDISQSTKN